MDELMLEPTETILIVDDDPLNLTILSNLLKDKYKIKVANNGETALRVAEADPDLDLILLDILMPGINGYVVCKRLKAHPQLKDIPVLFTSALSDPRDIIKGFEVGGVDYITKPFRPEEVNARVEVHIELRRAKTEIQSLLSKTLVGSVRLLLDVLTMTKPKLVQQSYRIRKYAKDIIKTLDIGAQDAWSIELAIMLSHIGCISFSDDLLSKVLDGKALTNEEQKHYMQYPELGAKLLENIPRLEKTATMIKNQLVGSYQLDFKKNQIEYIGSMLLNMLIVFDQEFSLFEDDERAYRKVVLQINGCPQFLLKALSDAIKNQKKGQGTMITVAFIRPGMVLAADLIMKDGTLLLMKNTELNENLIDLVHRKVIEGSFKAKHISVTNEYNLL